jgi:hypothetical protein
MAASTYANTSFGPDRRHIVGTWVLTVVLTVLTLGSLAGKAEAVPGGSPVPAAASVRAS